MTICPSCLNQVGDDILDSIDSSDLVCHSCGLVLSESTQFETMSSQMVPFSEIHLLPLRHRPKRPKTAMMEKKLTELCTALGLSSIISESTHVARIIFEQGFNGRFSRSIVPASVYIAMRSVGKSVPLKHLSVMSNVPISVFVNCAQKFKSLLNVPFSTIPKCAFKHSNLFEKYVNMILRYPELPPAATFPPTPIILSMMTSLFDLISNHSIIFQSRKPEVFSIALVTVSIYSYITFPQLVLKTLMAKFCKLNSVTWKRVSFCFDEISDFLARSFSILELPHQHTNPHQLLIYLPSLIKFIPLISSYLLYDVSTELSAKMSNKTSLPLSSRVSKALEWISNLSSQHPSSSSVQHQSLSQIQSTQLTLRDSYPPADYIDVQIRFLLLNHVSPTTILNLTMDGICSLASSFKANIRI